MSVKHVTKSQKQILAICTLLALLFAMYFLRNYFTMFVIAAIVAFLFSPLYERLQRRMSNGSAAAVTLVATLLAVVIPVTLIVILSIAQVRSLAGDVSSLLAGADISKLGEQIIAFINNILASIPFISYQVSEASITAGLTELVQRIGDDALGLLTSSISSLFSFFTTLIIYIYVFVSLLVNREKIVAILRGLNPLGDEISDLYLQKTAAMVKGTVRGQFIIAVLQGFVGATSIYIAGMEQAFFVFFLVLSALSLIPLGGGVLAIPVGVLMILFGNVWGGIFVIATHFLVTTNIDNILRPILVPQEARLDSALMIVSVFSGIAMFGFLGIVMGPVIMILIATTVKVYLEVYRGFTFAEPVEKRNFFSRIIKYGSRHRTS